MSSIHTRSYVNVNTTSFALGPEYAALAAEHLRPHRRSVVVDTAKAVLGE
jgi:hypothetical protein